MEKTRTIAFHTLGCKLNFAETSTIGRQLISAGYSKVDFFENPDVFLINTCSVTENADRECRTIVNRALKVNDSAIIVVTGCFAQLKPDAIAIIPGVDLVLGASEKFNASLHLADLFNKGNTIVKSCDISEVKHFNSSWSIGERTRVFLKVQDGCDYNCTFCTIPLARGKSRSNSIENIIDEANKIVAAGVKEIVLTGINLGDFGINFETGKRDATFYDLAVELEKIDGLHRIRISSIEPNLLEEKLIQLVSKSSKFVPHFHIPLQSGSDKILKKMRRRYLTDLYREKINFIHANIPGCCIGVDVITGFPGETSLEFNETYNFLNELNIAYLHVFTYSERDHTMAAEMSEIIPIATRKERTKKLRILSEKKLRNFYESQTGLIMDVLFEQENKNGILHGYTSNYVRVNVAYDHSLVNTIFQCRLEAIDEKGEMNVTLIESLV